MFKTKTIKLKPVNLKSKTIDKCKNIDISDKNTENKNKWVNPNTQFSPLFTINT